MVYVRSTRLPEGLHGFIRLAENKVRVNVIGTNGISTLKVVEAGGMVLLHERDAAALVNNTRALQTCEAELKAARIEIQALKDAADGQPD